MWGILRDPNEKKDIKIFEQREPLKLFPKRTRAVKLIYPVYNSGRIRAQKGVFTWHSHPKEDLAAQAETGFDDLDIIKLVKWPIKIDAPSRRNIVQELERLGINQRTIFPDLSGIAAGLWQTMVLWEGKK